MTLSPVSPRPRGKVPFDLEGPRFLHRETTVEDTSEVCPVPGVVHATSTDPLTRREIDVPYRLIVEHDGVSHTLHLKQKRLPRLRRPASHLPDRKHLLL